MSNQERLDKIENLVVSTASNVRIFHIMQFRGGNQELQQIENLLGDMLVEVLALKKDLGCTSTLSVVEPEQE